ncbi:hypothetical protein MRX96_018832 [Rhipicephalus microplus]
MNGGTCVAPGVCDCAIGYQGPHCEGGSLWKRPRRLLNRLCSSMLSLALSAALHAVGNIIVNAWPPNMAPGNHLALLDTWVVGVKKTKNLGLQ